MVLDPFAGSGMTLAVANSMQLKFTGFEVNQAYLKSFWSQVVPSVKNWYQEKHAQMILSDDEMERRLDKLKKLKFARTLSRKLIDNVPALRLASTFLLDKNDMVDVFLIYDEGRSQEKDELQTTAGEEAERLLTKSELKTFHVKAISHVLPAKEFIETMRGSLGSTDLWLYKRHHLYESSIRFDEWIAKQADETWREAYSMGKSPPMISNIDIYQKEVDLRKLPADE
jgi:hypothetical protein